MSCNDPKIKNLARRLAASFTLAWEATDPLTNLRDVYEAQDLINEVIELARNDADCIHALKHVVADTDDPGVRSMAVQVLTHFTYDVPETINLYVDNVDVIPPALVEKNLVYDTRLVEAHPQLTQEQAHQLMSTIISPDPDGFSGRRQTAFTLAWLLSGDNQQLVPSTIFYLDEMEKAVERTFKEPKPNMGLILTFRDNFDHLVVRGKSSQLADKVRRGIETLSRRGGDQYSAFMLSQYARAAWSLRMDEAVPMLQGIVDRAESGQQKVDPDTLREIKRNINLIQSANAERQAMFG